MILADFGSAVTRGGGYPALTVTPGYSSGTGSGRRRSLAAPVRTNDALDCRPVRDGSSEKHFHARFPVCLAAVENDAIRSTMNMAGSPYLETPSMPDHTYRSVCDRAFD